MSDSNGDDPTKTMQMGQWGNPEEIDLVEKAAIRLVPGQMFPIIHPVLLAMAWQRREAETLPKGWFWLSIADNQNHIFYGCFLTLAQTPYDALLRMYELNLMPPNGYYECVAWFYGYENEGGPEDETQIEKLLNASEAENFKWTTYHTP